MGIAKAAIAAVTPAATATIDEAGGQAQVCPGGSGVHIALQALFPQGGRDALQARLDRTSASTGLAGRDLQGGQHHQEGEQAGAGINRHGSAAIWRRRERQPGSAHS